MIELTENIAWDGVYERMRAIANRHGFETHRFFGERPELFFVNMEYIIDDDDNMAHIEVTGFRNLDCVDANSLMRLADESQRAGEMIEDVDDAAILWGLDDVFGADERGRHEREASESMTPYTAAVDRVTIEDAMKFYETYEKDDEACEEVATA